MSPDEIKKAMEEISVRVRTVTEAVKKCLDELGYDKTTYRDGSDETIEKLLLYKDRLHDWMY